MTISQMKNQLVYRMGQLLIYKIVYGHEWFDLFEAYSLLTGVRNEVGTIIVITLLENEVCTEQMALGVKELVEDLFSDCIVDSISEKEMVLLAFHDSLPVDSKGHSELVEKCGALYERINLVYNVSIRIGVGGRKHVLVLRDSFEEAKKVLSLTKYDVVHYGDIFSVDDKCNSRFQVAEDAVKFMRENYNKSISLVDVAEASFVSPGYLSTIIKENYGDSYISILTKIRIEKAQELLRETHFSVKTVGEQVGYLDAMYFNRVFKRNVGCTPLEYKNNYE